MKKSRIGIGLFAIACLTATAFAAHGGSGKKGGGGGGPTPTPSTFNPEFAYVKIGGRNKNDEIRMADAGGLNEVGLASLSQSIIGLDLSSDTRGLIAFSTLEGNLYLQRWSDASGAFNPSSPYALKIPGNVSGSIISPDFSSDGTKLAFIAGSSGQRTIYICNLGSAAEPDCDTVTPLTVLQSMQVSSTVRFYPGSNITILFSGGPTATYGEDGIYRYTLGDPQLPQAPLVPKFNTYDEYFDVGRAGGNSEALIVSALVGIPVFFHPADGTATMRSFAGHGHDFRFNCNNDALLYTETGSAGSTGPAVASFGGPIESLSIKSWSKRHDWMPHESCS